VNVARVVFAGLGLGAIVLVSGCAAPAKPEDMTPTVVPATHRSEHDVWVVVSGGKDTSKMGASQISDAHFGHALHDALDKSAVFSKISASGGYYKLSAYIGKVDQPTFGFSMTVTMEVSYSLTNTQSGQSVWTMNVTSTHTATTSDAFAGVERLRLADEGAAKNNIQQAIAALETVQL
jgi:hypothetical protein